MRSADENFPPAIFAAVLSFSTSGQYEPIASVHVPALLTESREPEQGGGFQAEHDPPEVVEIELWPIQPMPTRIETWIEFTDESGQAMKGPLQSIPIGFEDLFSETLTPADVPDHVAWRAELFDAMWAALGRPIRPSEDRTAQNGREVTGTQSVKLLEEEAEIVVHSVEQHLSRFVTGVIGERLVEVTKEGGYVSDVRWEVSDQGGSLSEEIGKQASPPLQLEWAEGEKGQRSGSGGVLGSFQVLIFLPPRYHLLLTIEVSDWSSLAHIRTDYWPCLAHVDEYLEALVGIT